MPGPRLVDLWEDGTITEAGEHSRPAVAWICNRLSDHPMGFASHRVEVGECICCKSAITYDPALEERAAGAVKVCIPCVTGGRFRVKTP